MTIIDYTTPTTTRILSRSDYMRILRAAITTREYRFAREAALNWLAAFPGDLETSLTYAKALIGENRPRQALPVLETLVQTDPEYIEAVRNLLQAEAAIGGHRLPDLLAGIYSLEGPSAVEFSTGTIRIKNPSIAEWGRSLWASRAALKSGDMERAEAAILQALGHEPPAPLMAVTHLTVLESDSTTPLEAKRSLAEYYHQRWPECVQCTLRLADWLMDGGEADQAVALLHQAASQDIGGQVAMRLWGTNHTYRKVWAEDLSVPLSFSIPASVAAVLGWNRLEAGNFVPEIQEAEQPLRSPAENASLPAEEIEDEVLEQDEILDDLDWLEMEDDDLDWFDSHPLKNQASQATAAEPHSTAPETLLPIQEELDKVAGKLDHPGVSRLDGRFPVYVIFSVRHGLEAQYGPTGAALIEEAMSELEGSIKNLPVRAPLRNWGAQVYLADEPSSTMPLDLKPAKPGDVWELKLALADLDAALAKRGERIGALLIVGGPEVVPFHHLPNPVDDDDQDVPSDNPYGTRDENYFIPEWPVGRLPGGSGQDPTLLLHLLGNLNQKYQDLGRKTSWLLKLWDKFAGWLRPRLLKENLSFGFTASIWRQAALAVFQPIGSPRSVFISPPTGVDGITPDAPSNLRMPITRLAYFNLHGLADAPEWYGQRDPSDRFDGPDYPIALRPQDITTSTKSGASPQVVFSEACYGAHIFGKSANDAISLKFLSSGSPAMVGATCMTYGSIAAPLIAADLLGYAFWIHLNAGHPVGEALRRAKIHTAREMHQRQGYLDGEDQKTLISFVLYGDPLFIPAGITRLTQKSLLRPVNTPSTLRTVCDRSDSAADEQPAPPEVTEYIKHIVSQYLPGMQDAQLSYSREHAECNPTGHKCPTSQLKSKSGFDQPPQRQLVTLSKQVVRSNHVHNHYARLTLDAQGRLVKLVVSR